MTRPCDSKNKEELKRCMNLKGMNLLSVFKVNESYIVGVYEGVLSKYDIVIRYRQRTKSGKWSRIRTPKHIHWAVDMLIKLQTEREKTKLRRWEEIEPIRSEEERRKRTSVEYLLSRYEEELNKYASLSEKGEYSIKFLILLAELLMTQEKTNRKDAYMFKELLKAIGEGEDIFKIVSIATHRGN